ncbi:hypothetical protein IFM89_015058 [Coptis chinensis]|uniref:Glucan endo-1,3-beta-D-glucosidase n=1 Tax=Coptis chinensis TaxID=261450 RepID=A0A835H654_9MAGN|nr:hypothetical protein IFM89_015058 [Coptis chinensis]
MQGAQPTGVCYGRDGTNLPPPAEVVALYRQRNIGRMRIYDPNQQVLEALRCSNIELMLGVPNPDLQLLASDACAASRWVQTNVRNFLPADKSKCLRRPTGVIGTSFPPSPGVFGDGTRSFFDPIIGFLIRTLTRPLFVNVYPYFSYTGTPNLKLSYALFTNPSPEFTDSGNNLPYQNLFDAITGRFLSASREAGGSSLEIVVSESGWPSPGLLTQQLIILAYIQSNLIDPK